MADPSEGNERRPFKQLVVVFGPAGVGKSATCSLLLGRLDGAVWLDADWLWMMNPFVVDDENKRMIERNIRSVLGSYFDNPNVRIVVLSWVVHEPAILEMILRWVADRDVRYQAIGLTCDEPALRMRLMTRALDAEAVNRNVSRIEMCRSVSPNQIDTTALTPDGAATRMLLHLQHGQWLHLEGTEAIGEEVVR